jgi:hypothetical protein
MTQQENNFKYVDILRLGYWAKQLPEIDTKFLIKELYEIRETFPSINRSNSGGYQSSSNLNHFPEFSPLVVLLNQEMFKLTKNPNIKISEMWGNISSFSNFNHIHTHDLPPNHYSGILYLQVPPHSGELEFYTPLNINNEFTYIPTEKDLVIFHSNLPHSVNPNLSKEDRISIAFNYG